MERRRLRFGIWDSLDRSGVPVHQLYGERLAMVEAAEAAGFFTYLLAEHHGTPLSMAPSPAIFLAAAAARTTRIRLGALCFILPLYDPLRLLEEIAMVDQLSHGRLDLGVTRGVSPHELGFFGVDAADSRSMFDESLQILLAGMTRDRLTFEGRHYRFDDVPMEVRPLQQPHPPLWYATSDPASVPHLVRSGYNLITGGPAEHARTLVDEYRRVWEAGRAEPGHLADPVVGLSRHVLVADSDDEARTIARAAHSVWSGSMLKLWHDHGDASWDDIFSWKTATEHETFIFGSPGTVRDRLTHALDVSAANYLNLTFSWGSLTHEQEMRSLRLFADEVMPALA